jgi:hypothetical protein
MINSSNIFNSLKPKNDGRAKVFVSFPNWLRSQTTVLLVLFALTTLTWLPRLNGPIDLGWDGGLYYILGTSLAQGKGYKLLNEPGEINALQTPPLLPAIVAAHQLILGTDDPTTVGRWLRFSAFFIFILYIYIIYRFFKEYLSLHWAFLATILCLFSLHVYYLSDLLYTEILFSLMTIVFVLCSRRNESRTYSVLGYVFAVASYALRTVGVAALVAWVLESFFRKQFKSAVCRAALALIPILCWQFYVASVESSYQYNHPAYAYQRAPYMFNNVTYARNVSLRDPFAPEKGQVQIVRRIVRNAIGLPADLGQSVTTMSGYWQWLLHIPLDKIGIMPAVTAWIVFVILYAIGLLVLAGLALLVWQRQWILVFYVFPYLAAICLTPFQGSFTRYLMPITPFLVLSLILFLLSVRNQSKRFYASRWPNFGTYFVTVTISVAILIQMISFIMVYKDGLEPIEYRDRNNQLVRYRIFFDSDFRQSFAHCARYVKENAKADDIIAAGTPHWLYLLTGLKAIMPPFESDAVKAQELLDSVPVSYLIIGKDLGSERYTLPVVQQFPDRWQQVYSVPESSWAVYQRVNR